MATIIERDIHHAHDDAASAVSILLAVLAVIVIAGLALYALQIYPFAGTTQPDTSTPIDVDVDTTLPAATNPAGTDNQ